MNEPNENHNQDFAYMSKQFLIAMPGMPDPNFANGVTLMCKHNDEGAIGITINRPSDFTLLEVLRQLDIECEDETLGNTTVFDGGPVHPERGFVLHTPTGSYESSILINDEITVTTSRDVLADIVAGTGPEKFIVALGYAGWEAGQLEHEIRENAWLNTDAESAIIFDMPVRDRWEKAVGQLGIDFRNLHTDAGYA
jgi:putative transcriptional regulator